MSTNFWKEELQTLLDSYEKYGGNWRPDHEQYWHDALCRAQNALKHSENHYADASKMVHHLNQASEEVTELVTLLRNEADDEAKGDYTHWIDHQQLRRAADLLEQLHTATVPVGMIPAEYWDIDSGARIVSEPSEEGPGGCWVVLNSRHINPFTEFPTAEAAWSALQAARALPLPNGEVN